MRAGLVCRFSLVAVVALALTSVASAELVGWWKFDDGSGTLAADSSGKHNDGTISGDAQWVVGKRDGALQFNGSNTNVQAPHIPFDSQSFTVAMWVNPVLYTAEQVVFSQGLTGSTNTDMHFRLGGPGSTNVPTGGARMGFYSNDLDTAGGLIQDNTWYHLTFWYDFDHKNRRIYINAEQKAEAAANPFLGTAGNTIIGSWGTGQWFRGIIDDVQVYNHALTDAEIRLSMEGLGGAGRAAKPRPAIGATDVPRDAVVGWTPGKYAQTHDVYFGSVFDDVNNAARTAPGDVLVSQGQDANTYDPAGLLAFGQTYYWRVDEVNAPPDSTIFKGDTWSFTSETYGYAVKPIKATASSSSNALMGPEKTIDGSGLDALDQHGVSATQMWLSKKGQSPIWIQYEFGKAYKLYQMWVWNSNQAVETAVGFGADDVTVETSLDGTTWTALDGVPEFAQATGEPNYTHSTTVDFGGIQAKYVKLTINSNWAGGTKQAGLSEVRFFYVPVKAFGPTPASGGSGVALNSTLNWRPGREAVQHQVYLGSDPNVLALVKTVTAHSLGLGSLGPEYGRIYYWRVDEVNNAAHPLPGYPASWQGDVWSFATTDYMLVDDFEGYDNTCKRIFFTWQDGAGHNGSEDCSVAPFGGNGTGSTVGNASPPFAEQMVVHSGQQSMPLAYDNTSSASSEAVLTFGSPQDWTQGGAKTLVLYFCGVPSNSGGPIYVKIDGTKVVYAGPASDLARRRWTQWSIDLKSSGAALQAVRSLTVGVGGSGGKGIVYIDDIRLYRSAPEVAQPVVPSTAGLIAYYTMENNVQDSSGNGNNGTLVGAPTYVQGPVGHGMAMQFNGADACVDLGKKPVFNPTGSLSISVWANITTWGTDWGNVMVGNRGEDSVGWQLRRHSSNKICFTTRGVGQDDEPSRMDAPLGEWIHIAAVYDNAGNTKRIYINGSQDALVTTNAGTVAAANHNVCIGARANSGNNGQEGFFSGMLDEVRIYTRALSEGEVAYLSNQ